MADENKITMTLDLDAQNFEVKIGNAKSQLINFSQAGEKSNDGWFKGIVGLNQGLELLQKGIALAHEGFQFLGEAIAEAAAHDQNILMLNQALSNSGTYTQEASKHFQELAEQISKTSKFSADSIIHIEGMARNFAISNAEAEKLTKAAVQLSAATGRDLDSSVQRLGFSLSGMSVGLGKMIPGMEKLTAEQLRNGAALDFILQKYGGTAENQINSFDGRMARLHNTFKEFMETLGSMITQSPVVNKAIELLTDFISKATNKLKEFVQSGGFERLIRNSIEFGQSIVTYVVAPLELLYNIGKIVFDGFILGVQTIIVAVVNLGNAFVQFIIPKVVWVLEQASKLIGIFNEELAANIKKTVQTIGSGITESYQVAADSTKSVMGEMIVKTNQDFSKLFDFSLSTNLSKRLTEIDEFAKSAKVKMASFKEGSDTEGEKRYDKDLAAQQASINAKIRIIEAGNVMIENAAQKHQQYQEQLEDLTYKKNIERIKASSTNRTQMMNLIEQEEIAYQQRITNIQQSYTNVSTRNFQLGWQSAIANMQKQYANFTNVTQTLTTKMHSNLSNSFISMAKAHKFSMDMILNQFLSMIGETMIQWGVFDIMASIWPPNPAGLAAGAALIAAGSVLVGIGGGGESAGATAGGAGASTGGGVIASPEMASSKEMERKSAQIIIQGDYLNSRETQTHLADVLRQNSDITDYAIVAQGKTY